ncbi:unnamed protein product, partial [Ixodes persulcatus]
MYPNIALVFRAAIRETAVEFGGDDFVDQLTPEIMSVFMGLAQRYPTSINAEVQETTFRAAQRQVYVPLGLINDSVPTNGTMFAFHLSRVAVRLFGSLVQLVNQYQDEDFTDHSQRTLDELLDCLARDWRALPSSFDAESKDVVPDVDQARYAILTQTAALRLAFVAFQ